jgi:small GTP-binding protein
MQELNRFLFKIALCGAGGVGKTSLYLRFLTHNFQLNPQMTMGVTIAAHYVDLPQGRVNLQIWDFGGQLAYRSLVIRSLQGVSGVILMFDLTRYSTFAELDEWRVTIGSALREPTPILLVGCKDDLCEQNPATQEITDEAIQQYIQKHKYADYIKTSAKTGKNVELCFQVMAGYLIDGPLHRFTH